MLSVLFFSQALWGKRCRALGQTEGPHKTQRRGTGSNRWPFWSLFLGIVLAYFPNQVTKKKNVFQLNNALLNLKKHRFGVVYHAESLKNHENPSVLTLFALSFAGFRAWKTGRCQERSKHRAALLGSWSGESGAERSSAEPPVVAEVRLEGEPQDLDYIRL